MDPFYQFPSYADFALENGIIKKGHAQVLGVMYHFCQYTMILGIPLVSSTVCMMTGFSIALPVYPEFNMYDIREPCVEPGLCYPEDHLEEVLNSELFRTKFNITG